MNHFLALFLAGQSLVLAVPEFKKNAAEFIEVGFNQGRAGPRYTELAVIVKPSELFEGEETVDIKDLSLEVKAGDGCWEKVGTSPFRRGRDKRMWRVKIVPCKVHSVRIGIKRDDCVDYLEYPDTVGPASADQIANSHFRPQMPDKISVVPQGGDSVSVSWSPSQCAQTYDLWYESDSGLDLGNMTVKAGAESVNISGLENCKEYTMKIVAIVGEEFSEEADAEFTTCAGNTTDMSDEIISEEEDDSTCKITTKQCNLSTQRFGDFTSSSLTVELEEDIDNTPTNSTETESLTDPEAQTGHATKTFTNIACTILSQLVLVRLLL